MRRVPSGGSKFHSSATVSAIRYCLGTHRSFLCFPSQPGSQEGGMPVTGGVAIKAGATCHNEWKTSNKINWEGNLDQQIYEGWIDLRSGEI